MDLKHLKEIAERATKGGRSIERVDEDCGDFTYNIHGGPEAQDICRTSDVAQSNAFHDAKFFEAVTPEVFLKILEEIHILKTVIREANPHVCSFLCPSIRTAGTEWTHTEVCRRLERLGSELR